MYNIEFKKYGAVTLASIYAARAISLSSETELSDLVIAHLEKNPDAHLLLDFTDVDYIASARLTDLLRIKDVVTRQGGSMRICGLNAEVSKVFGVTKLDEIFQIDKDHLKNCIKRYHKEIVSKRKGRALDSP